MMEIKQNLCPTSKYSLKCPYPMSPIGICIHNTANDASAASEIKYMISNASSTSFHFAVDDREVIQGLPLDRNAWHAGDGGSGTGNRKYIIIEICYSNSGGAKFEAAMKNAAKLTADLLKKYGWDISKVKKHQDFSGKYCPHRILSDYGWNYFLNLVKEEFNVSKFRDTKGHWAEKEINELSEMGIVLGDEKGNFRPDDKITRAEAAVLIRRAVRFITGE